MAVNSLYIHIPFCKKKCSYCDFNSYSNCDTLMENYSKALIKELEDLPKFSFDTIYIGGGTPTYLFLEGWGSLGEAIKKLNITETCEFSVEGNPGTFSREILKLFKDIGINRLSIGVQAMQDNLLKKIGRIHTSQEVRDSYNMAREIGFNNINMDLMFGLPNQTQSNWVETLTEVIKLSPEHISCYSLILEENTNLYMENRDNKIQLPEEDEEREMYEIAIKMLQDKDYIQYEISNFSRPNLECCHNKKYWDLEEYIGCGAGAASYINKCRYKNVESIEEYINEMSNQNSAKKLIKCNTLEDEVEEFVFMGLRKKTGISTLVFKDRFKKDIFSIYKEVLDKYFKNGLLIMEKDRIFLSKRGIDISNYIMSDFIYENKRKT